MNKAFDRILIVMFENQYRSYVMQHAFMRKMAAAGCNLTNYFGVFHPSQTNYIGSLAAELCGVTNDTPPYPPLRQQTLVDLMQPEGAPQVITWKAYMEGYPSDRWNPDWRSPSAPASGQPVQEFPDNGTDLAYYYRKHNAFASFYGIQSSAARWANIVDENAFWNDVFNGALPQYGWFTPDIWNDGHYLYNTLTDTNPRTQLIPQMAGWLEYVFFGNIDASKVQGASASRLATIGFNLDFDLLPTDAATAYAQSSIPSGTLVVVTFDEADYDANGYDTNYDGPNQIYTVLLGDMIAPGTEISVPHNHYSLMKTVEVNFGLGSLNKNDRGANWLRALWDESFSRSDPAPVHQKASGSIALATYAGTTYLVYQGADNDVMVASFDGRRWSPPEPTGVSSDGGQLALAAADDSMTLVFTQDSVSEHEHGKDLHYATFDTTGGWSAPRRLGQRTGGAFALTAYTDCADQISKLMLAWQSAESETIHSLRCTGGRWDTSVTDVGQLTDGPMAVSQLGASLYLVYKERNSYRMRMTSYNTAPFNAFTAMDFAGAPAPDNDTSLHRWSPMDFQVAHFAKKFGALANDYTADSQLALAAIEGEMHLVHRGQFSDTPNAYTEVFGLTGVLTAASWKSNGYGTVDQAGWTKEEELRAVTLDPAGAIALCTNGARLVLVYQQSGGDDLFYCVSGYRRSPKNARTSST